MKLLLLVFFVIIATNTSLVAQTTNTTTEQTDTIITSEKLINTSWEVVKTNRQNDDGTYTERKQDPKITYTFKRDGICIMTYGATTVTGTWQLVNGALTFIENIEHAKFDFFAQSITATNLVIISNYKAEQQTFISLTKLK